jgi:isoleucyl-tRNA synthetase
MSDPKIKEKLIKENEDINWEPSHLREGRFGEWLREIKDWAISRERYWGTPLPVWTCKSCNKIHTIGSLEELKKKTKKSGNKYFVMRHGESESNLKKIVINCKVENEDHLSDLGKEQVKISAKELKDKNVDIIISSDFIRTKETSEIIKEELDFRSNIVLDQRLREWNVGVFDGKTWDEYISVASSKYYYTFLPEGGESWKQIKNRMMELISDLDKKYKNKNILLISHGAPIRVLLAGLNGESDEEVEKIISDKNRLLVKNAEVFEFDFTPLPHNEDYELDLHRPYIDEVELVCDCGGDLVRSKEVMDVWLDSGTMPFSQDHYPFENKEWVEGEGYPADFISEAIDQTRGWFYTLHAVGVLLGRGKAFKNVICLGHLLDANGKKMSKSLGNVVDPWEMIEKYGVDTIRLWMYSVNQPGESKNFDEKTVLLLHRQVFGLLYNILSFYELYRDIDLEKNIKLDSKNILDKWILARLDELIKYTTSNLENYKLLEPVRAIRDFIDDLSTWYLRRSRENIKEGDKETKQTLYYVLKNLTQILAPFAPLSAEDIWLKLNNDDTESVHLSKWPRIHKSIFDFLKKKKSSSLIEDMKKTREIVTLGLDARQKNGIKVRQPLSVLKIKESSLGGEYLELIKDELNVKEIVIDQSIESDIWLDVNITPELKEEGDYRELLRAIQDTRKKLELTPTDIVSIHIQTNEKGESLINRFEIDLLKTAGAKEILLEKVGEEDDENIKIDELEFKLKISK